ncbi:MAG: hypothetical protein ACP5HC_02495 [Caldisericum sp.]
MIFETEGYVAGIGGNKSIIYLTLFTPLGRINCYASKSDKKPNLRGIRFSKYGKVWVKLFSKSRYPEGLTKFPCEVIDFLILKKPPEEEEKRKIFRYISYFCKTFSVVKSGDSFFNVFESFNDFLELEKEEFLRSSKEKILNFLLVEVLVLGAEGLVGALNFCEHVLSFSDSKVGVFILGENSFLCFECFEKRIREGKESVIVSTKYTNKKSIMLLNEFLSFFDRVSEKGFLVNSLREGKDFLESNFCFFDEFFSIWDFYFKYNYLTYCYSKRGEKFLEFREKLLSEFSEKKFLLQYESIKKSTFLSF